MSNSDLKLTKAEAGRLGGIKGGSVSSEAKAAASRVNGSKGGRPRKYANASERQRAHLDRKREEDLST